MTDDLARPLKQANDWLAAHRRLVLAILLSLAALVRGVVYVELCDSPVFAGHEQDQMDTFFFDSWGARIAGGDLLGREPDHPVHMWHTNIAQQYYANVQKSTFSGDGFRNLTFDKLPEQAKKEATKKIWDEWYGGPRFHQEPVYPYFIGLVYAVFGVDDTRERTWMVYFFQVLLSVFGVALMYGVARRAFGDLSAVAASLMMIGWAPSITYEFTLLRVTFITVAGLALLYATQRLADEPKATGRWRWLLYGALVALTTLIKSSFMLLSLGFLAGLLWQVRRDRRLMLTRASLVVGAMAICLLPLVIRNLMVGASPFSMTSVAAITFAASNAPMCVPHKGWFPYFYANDLCWIMDQTEGRVFDTVVTTLKMHDGLGSYFSQLGAKIAMMWHWFEIPNNTCVYWTYENSVVLKSLRYVLSVLWIMPMAVVGIGFALWKRRNIAMWIWFLLGAVAPMLVFYVLSRFRVPFVVGLMPLAAYGMLQIVDHAMHRRWLPSIVGTLVGAVLCFAMNRDLTFTHNGHDDTVLEIEMGPYGMSFVGFYLPKIKAAREAGDAAETRRLYEEFFALAPDRLEGFDAGHVPTEKRLQIFVKYFSQWYDQAAKVMREDGYPELAAEYAKRAKPLLECRANYVQRYGEEGQGRRGR